MVRIHDIVPTKERLFAIHLIDTGSCRQCGTPDTILHRLTECAQGTEIWEWTRHQMAMILRVDQRHIPSDWLLTPYFQFRPPQRQRVIMWILAHLVWCRMQGQRPQTLADYIDYMRRSRWKAYTHTARQEKVGNYLGILYAQCTRRTTEMRNQNLADNHRNTNPPPTLTEQYAQRQIQTIPDHESHYL